MSNQQQKFVPQNLSKKKKPAQTDPAKELVSWILSFVIAVGIALLLRIFVFDFVIVDGSSMEETLYSGQIVFVEKLSYRFHEPEQGDIIVCRYNEGHKKYVKRVIGEAQDELAIEEGSVFVNGMKLEEPYIKEEMAPYTVSVSVPDDYVFVMGDNRNNSRDSRDPQVGPIPYDRVRGKAVLQVWPLSRFGKIEK